MNRRLASREHFWRWNTRLGSLMSRGFALESAVWIASSGSLGVAAAGYGASLLCHAHRLRWFPDAKREKATGDGSASVIHFAATTFDA